MAVEDAGLGQMRGKPVLGEALLARHGCRANVEHELHARLSQRRDEAVDASPLIADGVDGARLHRRAIAAFVSVVRDQMAVLGVVAVTECSVQPPRRIPMRKAPFIAAVMAVAALLPACGADNADWCTDAHMQQMDDAISKMTDADAKATATMHLDMSKAEMKKGDTAACIKHMEEAHQAMGM